MKFIQLTRRDGEHVWVNMEHVCHIDRSRDVTVLKFAAGGGEGVRQEQVRPHPTLSD